MRSMVPGQLIDALPSIGVATMRFNFRGMGASTGAFDGGIGEQLDVLAAIEQMSELTEGLPLALCGSSFGADTALSVADERVSGWCAMAPPLRDKKLERMVATGASDRPKLLIVAERDNFRLPDSVREVTSHWRNTEIATISGADHFFIGKIESVVERCCGFVQTLTETHNSSQAPAL